jgi:hypothetical protein
LLLRLFIIAFFAQLGACGPRGSEVEAPPLPAGSLQRFEVIGDSRGGLSIYGQLLQVMTMSGVPPFAVHLGDMISSPDHGDEFPVFAGVTHSFIPRERFYPLVGNHDANDPDSFAVARSLFPTIPETGYDAKLFENIFCVFLASEAPNLVEETIGAAQIEWLRQSLASPEALNAAVRAVFLHRPPFPFGHHASSPVTNALELHQIFQEFRVSVVYSGHEHLYGHSEKDQIHYIVSGGGGSPLWQEAGANAFYHFVRNSLFADRLFIQVISLTGRIHEEITIPL